MATPKKKKSGSKRKLKIKSKIGVRKKSAVKKQATQTQDTLLQYSLPQAATKVPDNGATIRIKIRKKLRYTHLGCC